MPDLRCPDPACIGNTSDDEHPQFTLLIMVDEHQNPCFPLAKVEAEEFTCVYCDLKVAPPKMVGTERIAILPGRTYLQTAHVEAATPAVLWEDDLVQFARLLCEITATTALDYGGWVDLLKSMDLETEELAELFERAHMVFERTKAEHCPSPLASTEAEDMGLDDA